MRRPWGARVFKQGDFAPHGILDNIWRFFDGHNSGILPASSRDKSGMLLLNISQCIQHSPHNKHLSHLKCQYLSMEIKEPARGKEELVHLVLKCSCSMEDI